MLLEHEAVRALALFVGNVFVKVFDERFIACTLLDKPFKIGLTDARTFEKAYGHGAVRNVLAVSARMFGTRLIR